MNAQKLMEMASDAEAKAKYYASLNAASGLDREQYLAREQYFNGQASGFRQAAWVLSNLTGENVND